MIYDMYIIICSTCPLFPPSHRSSTYFCTCSCWSSVTLRRATAPNLQGELERFIGNGGLSLILICRSCPQSLSTSNLIHLGSSMIQEPTMFHHAQCTFAQVQRFYNILLQLETGIPSAWSMLCSCFAKNGPGWVCPHSTLTQNQLNEWWSFQSDSSETKRTMAKNQLWWTQD